MTMKANRVMMMTINANRVMMMVIMMSDDDDGDKS